MRTTSQTTIKALFQTGDVPTQADFYRIIESLFTPYAYAEVTATADQYVATLEINGTAISIDALSENELYLVGFDSSNTGPTQLNLNSKGLKNIKKYSTSGTLLALDSDDIVSDVRYLLQYDGTQFILVNPLPATPSGGGTTYNRTGTTGGTANTYTLAATGYSAHASDVLFAIQVNNANTGASTININSLGAVALKKNSIGGNVVDLEASDLRPLQTYLVVFDGTQYIVLNPLQGSGKILEPSYNFVQQTALEIAYEEAWRIDSKTELGGTVAIYSDSTLTTAYTLGTTVAATSSLWIYPSAAGVKVWLKGRRGI